MDITHSYKQLNIHKKAAIAVGYFDGMHIGHRKLISTMCKYAEEKDMTSVLLTFDMSELRADGKGKKDLFPREYNVFQAEKLGAEIFAEIPFADIRDMTPKKFCREVLADEKGLHAGAVFCGEDFRFGKNRSGSVEELRLFGADNGYDVEAISGVYIGDELVSTSKIKDAIENGDIKKANTMLGEPYAMSGEVIHGNHLARGLGFPTANVLFPPNVVIPKKGVYLTETTIGEYKYRSITNIGTRPTLTDDVDSTTETHILDFSGDLYGKIITVIFYDFVRPEQKFFSVKELKCVVEDNIRYARRAVID